MSKKKNYIFANYMNRNMELNLLIESQVKTESGAKKILVPTQGR